ncbi:MAG: hypothetical protein IJU20_04650 [Clostridia bacterium]|nr:hypothetical protein [Clostridia bacterium]
MLEETWPRRRLDPEQIRRLNNTTVDAIARFLNLAPDAVDLSVVRDLAERTGVSTDYAYAVCLASLFGLESVGEGQDYFRNYFVPMVHQLSPESFRADPYYRCIRIPEASRGNWQLRTQTLKPGEGFICDDFKVFPDGRLVPQVGFFDEPFSYPAVLQNGREWMTLMPNETVTSREAVERSRGNVLTFGLGLGYFAYMASIKPEVAHLTVVELDPDVISLFNEFILPQFPLRDKIEVIQSDAFDYAEKRMKKGQFDFVFADIWHDVGDGKDLYLRMKEVEKKFPGTEFVYWLENSIRCYLRPELWPDPPRKSGPEPRE